MKFKMLPSSKFTIGCQKLKLTEGSKEAKRELRCQKVGPQVIPTKCSVLFRIDEISMPESQNHFTQRKHLH